MVKPKGRRNDVQLYAVYRFPNSTKTNNDDLCTWIESLRGVYVIIGDFNFPDIRWQTGVLGSKGQQFLETVHDKFLHQHVETETHNSGNVLDLILTNDEQMISDEKTVGQLGQSDHHIVMCSLQTKSSRSNNAKKDKDFKRAN